MTLLRNVYDVGEGDDVDHKGKGAYHYHGGRVGICRAAFYYSVQSAVSIEHRQGCPLAGSAVQGGALEERIDLCEGVGTVLNPAAPVPEDSRDGRGKEQGDATEPGVGREAVVGVGEVPHVIDHDVNPGHIRPEHIGLVL